MKTKEQRPLFAFGTLMDRDVLKAVLRRNVDILTPVPARLFGYRTARVSDETYPVLVNDLSAHVDGVVLYGLDGEDWQRIRFFESDEYELAPCLVSVEGADIEALCCVGDGVYGIAETWTLDWWCRHHKQQFLQIIGPYMAWYGRADVEQAEELWAALQRQFDLKRSA